MLCINIVCSIQLKEILLFWGRTKFIVCIVYPKSRSLWKWQWQENSLPLRCCLILLLLLLKVTECANTSLSWFCFKEQKNNNHFFTKTLPCALRINEEKQEAAKYSFFPCCSLLQIFYPCNSQGRMQWSCSKM